MNWYKLSQLDIQQQYAELMEQVAAINITGMGQNESITIPGSSLTITARELLERAKMQIASILIENGVREIDTSPIPDMRAQGLAISHRPGVIFIDVQKIFNLAKQALPATSQFDGINIDPDVINGLINNVSDWIYRELAGTLAHESWHIQQYRSLSQEGKPFTEADEPSAEQYQRQMQDRYAPFKRNLPY